jgi:hypothetical protein
MHDAYQDNFDLKNAEPKFEKLNAAKDQTTKRTGRIVYKYNENELIEELQEYVNSTYDEHYSQDKFQATEFIINCGHGEGFALGNVLKYSQRYGRKEGKNRKDLLKILHYALIALHVHDLEQENS